VLLPRPLLRFAHAFPFALVTLLSLAPQATAQTCSGPGKERWPVKTSLAAPVSASQAKAIKLSDLLALELPPGVKHNDARYADARIPSFPNSLGEKEGDLITTTGWLYLVALESNDCDYHMQISPESRTTTNPPTPADNCIIVEAPRQDFVNDPDLKQRVTTIRSYIQAKIMHGTKEPANAGSVMIHAVCVQVTGALFYDDAHIGKNGPELRGKRGMLSKTLWELHPLTSLQIVPSRQLSVERNLSAPIAKAALATPP